MTRTSGALVCGLLLATSCMTDPNQPQTDEVEQGLADCNPGKNFPKATMPAQPWWNGGTPPVTGYKAGYVVVLDASGTYYNAMVADTSTGTISYAVKVAPGSIGLFLQKAGSTGRIDVIRVPPAPPPSGTDWLARYALEYELRAIALPDFAYNASF